MNYIKHIFLKRAGLMLLLGVLCSGSAIAGTITVTGSLNSFLTSRRVASASQSYTVSGTSLTTNITITPPTGYEVSTNNSTFSSAVTLTHTGGTISTTTIYVRMSGASRGTFSGNITHASSGSTTQNLAVSGFVRTIPTETYYQGTDVGIGANGNQNGVLGVPIGFDFTIFGSAASTFNLSAHGYIQFPHSSQRNVNANTPQDIPVNSSPNQLIALYWTGMFIDPENCNYILYKTVGTAPNRKLIIQYTNVLFEETRSPLGTLQIILYEGTNVVQLQYRRLLQTNMSFGQVPPTGNTNNGATIGIETSGTAAVKYSFNTKSIYEGLAIRFTPSGSTFTMDTTVAYDGILIGKEATAPPGLFDIDAPGPASTSVSQLTKFWWKPSTDITSGYRLIVSTDSTLQTNIVVNTVIADTSFRLSTLQQLTGGVTYWWQITALGTGCNITKSPLNSFVASTSPPKYATFSPASPLNFGSLQVGSTSSPTVVTVTRANITSSITATISGDFTLNGGTSSITIPAGTGADTTLDIRFVPTATGSRTGKITLTGGGLDYDEIYDLTGTGTAATPTITTTANLNTFSTPQGTASAAQSYTVSATGLTANLTIQPPGGYEVSTTSNGTFSSSLTLTPSSGTISSTTIYVRMTGASAGTISGNIAHSSTGATTQNVVVTGNVGLITVSGTLNAFSTSQGTVSAEQSYTVSGSGLSGNITVNAPSGFAISTTSGGTFGSSLTLTPTSGTLSSTTIYVRMTGATAGSYNDNISHSASNATTQNKAVTGTVGLISVTASLNAFSTAQGTASAEQSYTVSGSGLTANITINAPTGFEISTTSGGTFGSSVTLTQSGGTVSSTTIYVRLSSAATGTPGGNISHASTGATTQNVVVNGIVRAITVSGSLAAFSTAQGTPSASQSYTVSGTNLTENITITAPTGYEVRTGSNAYSGTVTLTPSSGTVSLTTIDVRLTGTGSGTVSGNISHTSTGASSPTIAITGTVRTITVSASLNAFSTAQGTPSTSQSYTVSGTGLTTDITITAPPGFEIRTGSNAYSNTVTLSQTGGSVSSTIIDVRLTGVSAGSFSGDITHTSTGASSPNVAVTGTTGLITISGTLNAFSTPQGTASASQSYTVSGSGLTGNITINAPTGYEIRTGSNAFGGTVTLSQTNGTVSATTIDVRLTGASAGLRGGDITHASTGVTTQNKAVSGAVGLITVSGTLNAFSTNQGTPSSSQNYTVSATGLAGDLTITAPSGYEIRTGGNAFGSSITLTPTSGAISSTTIDVRLTGANAGTFNSNITHSSSSATTQNKAVSGTVTGPTVNISGMLNAFTTPQGTPSSSQSYTVSGTGLTNDITITAPTGFEIRTGSNAYSGSITLTPTSGTVSSTTIDVRLTGTSAGLYSDNIANASTGATTQNVNVSGNVPLITTSGTLTAFTAAQGNPSSSQSYTVSGVGLTGDITINAPTGYEIRTGSNSYSGTVTLSPTSGSVSSTTIDVRLTGANAGLPGGNISHAATGATTKDVAVSGSVGLITVSGTLNSFSTTQGSPSASQSYTVSASGLTGDITITAPTGYEIRTGSNSYSGTVTLTQTGGSVSSTTIDVRLTGASAGTFNSNIIHAASGGATTQNKAVNGTVTGVPTITVSGTLNAFSTVVGTPSASQSYTVSATSLTADITITAPAGYEIRTGSNAYGSTVTLTQSGGTVSSTTIDVRLTGASIGTFSDNITHASTGATTQNKAVSGTVSASVTTPTVTTTAYITGIRLTSGTAAGNVTSDGGASVTARGVCWNTSGTPTVADFKTTDGTGTGSFTSSITGLTNNTVYYVRAYATNSAGTSYGATVKFTAGRVYVSASATGANEGSIWTDAYTDLATAISRIDSGEVWVAAGTYKPTATTDRTISFTAKNNIALLGGFAGNENAASSRNAASNVTTLSGEIGSAGSSDNSYHVIAGIGLDTTAIIDGFTITAGNCNGSAASNYDKGAGLYLTGSPFLKRLIITGNSGTQAIGLYNLGTPTISYVTYGTGNTWIVKKP
jgi:predicted membrane protein